MSPPVEETDYAMDQSLDERIQRMQTRSPEGHTNEENTSLLPKFLEFTAKESDNKFASTEQIRSLQQVECDQEDAKITDRLKIGVRPGNFCKEFERLSFVKNALTNANCQPFLVAIRDWMAKMAETCKGVNALPENVNITRISKSYLLTIVNASTACDSIGGVVELGPTRVVAIVPGSTEGASWIRASRPIPFLSRFHSRDRSSYQARDGGFV
jgi:hypothetical protein